MAKRGRKPNYQKWYEKYQKKLKRKYKNYFLNWKGQYVAPHYKEKEFISDINLYFANERIKSAVEQIVKAQAVEAKKLLDFRVDNIIDNLYRKDIKGDDFANFQNELKNLLGPDITRTKLQNLFIKNDRIITKLYSIFDKYSNLFNIDYNFYIQ